MTPSELLTRYESLGFRLVYWERKGADPKLWKGPIEKGWNDPQRAYLVTAFNPEVMNLVRLFCHRCQHAWLRRKPTLPQVCPKCKNPRWQTPRKEKVA